MTSGIRPEPLRFGPDPLPADLDRQERFARQDREREKSDACPCCGQPEPCNVRQLPARLRLITTNLTKGTCR